MKQTSGRWAYASGASGRWAKVGFLVGSVAPFFAALSANAKTLNALNSFDPNEASFNNFKTQYAIALGHAADTNQLSHNDAIGVRDAFVAWIRVLGQDDVADQITSHMGKWIDLNIPAN